MDVICFRPDGKVLRGKDLTEMLKPKTKPKRKTKPKKKKTEQTKPVGLPSDKNPIAGSMVAQSSGLDPRGSILTPTPVVVQPSRGLLERIEADRRLADRRIKQDMDALETRSNLQIEELRRLQRLAIEGRDPNREVTDLEEVYGLPSQGARFLNLDPSGSVKSTPRVPGSLPQRGESVPDAGMMAIPEEDEQVAEAEEEQVADAEEEQGQEQQEEEPQERPTPRGGGFLQGFRRLFTGDREMTEEDEEEVERRRQALQAERDELVDRRGRLRNSRKNPIERRREAIDQRIREIDRLLLDV
jgi:hypothetical protein